jgi:hypothetical protein
MRGARLSRKKPGRKAGPKLPMKCAVILSRRRGRAQGEPIEQTYSAGTTSTSRTLICAHVHRSASCWTCTHRQVATPRKPHRACGRHEGEFLHPTLQGVITRSAMPVQHEVKDGNLVLGERRPAVVVRSRHRSRTRFRIALASRHSAVLRRRPVALIPRRLVLLFLERGTSSQRVLEDLSILHDDDEALCRILD